MSENLKSIELLLQCDWDSCVIPRGHEKGSQFSTENQLVFNQIHFTLKLNILLFLSCC